MTKPDKSAAILARLKKDGLPQADLDALETKWKAALAVPSSGGSVTSAAPGDLIRLPEGIHAAFGDHSVTWRLLRNRKGLVRGLELLIAEPAKAKGK